MSLIRLTNPVAARANRQAGRLGNGRSGTRHGASAFSRAVLSVVLVLSAMMALAGCGDSKIQDPPEVAAFLSDERVSAKDVEVAKALKGSIDALGKRGSGGEGAPRSADEYVSALESSRWPDVGEGWESDPQSPWSAKAWIRLAELAEAWIEEETERSWDVIDFAYPFPDNGPIPVPATRGERDFVSTRLVCTTGAAKGLVATVRYYRWERSAYHMLDSALEELDEARASEEAVRQAIAALPEVGGREVFSCGSEVYVMESEVDATENAYPLRDQATFDEVIEAVVEVASDQGAHRTSYVSLIPYAERIDLRLDPLSSAYPNETLVEGASHEDAILLLESGCYELDHVTTIIDGQVGSLDSGAAVSSSKSIVGAEYADAKEAFADVGFEATFPESIDEATPTLFQSLPSAHTDSVRMLLVQYYTGGWLELVPYATVYKEPGTMVTRGPSAIGESVQETTTLQLDDGRTVDIGWRYPDADQEPDTSFRETIIEWTTVDNNGEQWAHKVLVSRILTDAEARELAMQVS